jgi:hypothetical protein
MMQPCVLTGQSVPKLNNGLLDQGEPRRSRTAKVENVVFLSQTNSRSVSAAPHLTFDPLRKLVGVAWALAFTYGHADSPITMISL